MTDLNLLLDGRGLLESPRWHDGAWYVSDWSSGEVLAITPDRTTRVVARVDSLPLCTAWHPDGRLLVVSSAAGAVLAVAGDGSLTTYADLGRPGWNDVVVDGRGNCYVNAPGFDPLAGEDPRPGGIVLVDQDGRVREVAGDLAFPNGMAVTPDNSTLLVADSYRHELVAFDIEADGRLGSGRTWADLGDGTPDGICTDAEGAVWYADVPHQACVRVAEGGQVLQTIRLDRGGFACALGGADGRTLCVVTAQWRGMAELVTPGSGQVLTAEVDLPGAGWP
jgi:sugar lactone lactonase YvrE